MASLNDPGYWMHELEKISPETADALRERQKQARANYSSLVEPATLRRLVRESARTASEAGRPDVARGLRDIRQRSIRDQNLFQLLQVILDKNATPEQNLEFQDYLLAVIQDQSAPLVDLEALDATVVEAGPSNYKWTAPSIVDLDSIVDEVDEFLAQREEQNGETSLSILTPRPEPCITRTPPRNVMTALISPETGSDEPTSRVPLRPKKTARFADVLIVPSSQTPSPLHSPSTYRLCSPGLPSLRAQRELSASRVQPGDEGYQSAEYVSSPLSISSNDSNSSSCVAISGSTGPPSEYGQDIFGEPKAEAVVNHTGSPQEGMDLDMNNHLQSEVLIELETTMDLDFAETNFYDGGPCPHHIDSDASAPQQDITMTTTATSTQQACAKPDCSQRLERFVNDRLWMSKLCVLHGKSRAAEKKKRRAEQRQLRIKTAMAEAEAKRTQRAQVHVPAQAVLLPVARLQQTSRRKIEKARRRKARAAARREAARQALQTDMAV